MFRSKNSQTPPEPKNSRTAEGQKFTDAPTGANDALAGTTSRNDKPERQAGSVEDIAAQLDALKRRQRRAIARGVAVVVLPPVVLCIPFIVLKAFHLLLISWGWCLAPLLLLLVPFVQAFRTYFAAVRAFRTQRNEQSGSQPDERTEGAK